MRDNGTESNRSLSNEEQKSVDVIPVPLPTEIPQPPDFSKLPPQVLHSGTVETLIGLNEDLLSRLKVNLRRNSVLEQQILDYETKIAELRRMNDSVSAQMMILKEKDNIWKSKDQKVESQLTKFRSEIQLLEIRYAELYSTSQEKQEKWKKEKERLHFRMRLLDGFQRRTQNWVRRLLNKLKADLRQSRAEINSQAELLQRKDREIAEFKERVQGLTQHIFSQERNFQDDQSRLVEQYEKRQRELQGQVRALTVEVSYFKERAQRLDEATYEKTETENQNVLLMRRYKELESKYQADITELQKQLTGFRSEAKTLAVELAAVNRDNAKLAEQNKETQAERERIQDQIESLQILWSEAQKNLEQLNLRNESLNKLNQELSKKLREQRQTSETSSVRPHEIQA